MEKKQRNIAIDLVKAVAIIFVVAIHTCSDGFYYPVDSSKFISTTIIRSFVSAAVPLFLISSGALMLNPQKPLTVRRLWTKNILRLVVAMLFWAVCYKIFYLVGTQNLSFATFYHSLKEVLLFNQEFHLYYIHITLLVYAFLPITKSFVANSDDKTLRYFAVIWFVTAILFPTIYMYWPFRLIQGFPLQWIMNMSYASIGYGVMGYYFTKNPTSLQTSIILTVAGFLSVSGLTLYYSIHNGSLFDSFIGGMSVPVCVFALGIFNLCKYITEMISKKEKCISIITYISKASFCIYLIHIFVLRIFNYIGLNATLFHPALSIPTITLLNVSICLVLYFILSKIPVINKWLI